MAEPLEVELTPEQLRALCVAVAWSLEDESPAPELADVRPALESAEELLLTALADLQLAGWVGTGEQSGVA